MVNQLKTLAAGQREFTANGKKYFSEQSLCFERWNKFEEIQVEIGIGVDFKNLYKKLQAAWTYLNAQEFGNSSVEIHDLMTGVKKLEDQKRVPSGVRLCTLFINYEGEDRGIYSEEMVKMKMDDWNKEGYDVNGFFVLAISFIPNLIEAFKGISNGTFPAQK